MEVATSILCEINSLIRQEVNAIFKFAQCACLAHKLCNCKALHSVHYKNCC
jgi:hypothetical protein